MKFKEREKKAVTEKGCQSLLEIWMLKQRGFKYSKDVWLNDGCDQPLKPITTKITDFSSLSDTQVEARCLFGRCPLG